MKKEVVLAIISSLIFVNFTIPYIIDILKGKVQPARATNIMFVILLSLTLYFQFKLNVGTTIVFTVMEFFASLTIFILSIKYGIGGLDKLDLYCYVGLAISYGVYLITKMPLLALHLSLVCDLIAVTPMLVKTYKMPKSETPLFYFAGIIPPILIIFTESHFQYSKVLFPVYICIINFVSILLIYRIELTQKVFKKNKNISTKSTSNKGTSIIS